MTTEEMNEGKETFDEDEDDEREDEVGRQGRRPPVDQQLIR